MPPTTGALALDTYELTKRFGAFTALDHVSMNVEPGTVHALLGENGAGKSTLVKCMVGYHRAEEGSILVDGREQDIANPMVARALGHRHGLPALHPGAGHDGGRKPAARPRQDAGRHQLEDERAELDGFLATTPFRSTWTRRRRSWRPARSRSWKSSSSST